MGTRKNIVFGGRKVKKEELVPILRLLNLKLNRWLAL
jgi:hypothetical protein